MTSADITLRKPLERAVLNITLTITRELRLRMWAGRHLLVWGAKILGCPVHIEIVTPGAPETNGDVKIDGVLITSDTSKFTDELRRASAAVARLQVNEAQPDVGRSRDRRQGHAYYGDACTLDPESCKAVELLRRTNEAVDTQQRPDSRMTFTATSGDPDPIQPQLRGRRFSPVEDGVSIDLNITSVDKAVLERLASRRVPTHPDGCVCLICRGLTPESEHPDVPHEYGPTTVGHGEAQCVHCHGTNRENAIISPNHCEARAKKLAMGGEIPPGKPYLVGQNSPEVMIHDQSKRGGRDNCC